MILITIIITILIFIILSVLIFPTVILVVFLQQQARYGAHAPAKGGRRRDTASLPWCSEAAFRLSGRLRRDPEGHGSGHFDARQGDP